MIFGTIFLFVYSAVSGAFSSGADASAAGASFPSVGAAPEPSGVLLPSSCFAISFSAASINLSGL